MAKLWQKIKKLTRIVGPGIITGAADDDPSGIATYSQTGAKFGYGQLWTMILMLPLMISVQEACARIGAVTGKGIAAVLKEHYTKQALYFAVILVLIANTINIGADLGAMGAATALIFPISLPVLILFFTAVILILEIFVSYKNYAKFLKWLTLSMFSYVITVFIINAPWQDILKATFIPHFESSFSFAFIIMAVLGTTISPYMFFWEASEEVEEANERHSGKNRAIGARFIKKLRLDNFLGMLSSQIAAWCIIVVAGTVLNKNGITNVASAADAAKALIPLVHTFSQAGLLAEIIFALGIVGLGLLAIPVLSASASYAISETFNWREGLNLKLRRGHGFYGVITIATIIGLAINFIGINPIDALVFTSVINGIISVPLIFMIWRISSDERIMGENKNGPLSNIFIWLTFLVMGMAAAGLFLAL